MTSTVGFVGLGNIGSRVVAHLVKAGHDVAVYDLNTAAVEAAVALGARSVSSPGEAATKAAALFLSLPTPAIVDGVVTEVLSLGNQGLVIVDHSTIDPDTSRRLAEDAHAAGASFLDAPVSGGVQGAEAGTLAVMLGGDEDTVKKVIPLIESYAGNIFHVGPSGSGQAIKLANNQITAANIVALGEGLSSAVAAGVDLDTAVAVLTKSSANSNVLSNYFPKTLFTEERPTGFALDFMHKDLGLFLAAAGKAKLPTPVTGLVRDLFSIGQRDGRGGKDFTSVVEFYEDFTGIRLQTKGHDK
ncbi:NAD(P)-dependent oxidoreductase [Rhodococcus sp. T2V]|uniref:NAD(P)-dependent oxidoreductase n=1 Tax=Rhodococcus sp. T2V TaxID=3034164 RepID=UPI0023E1AD9B|nr:NAD(P)-dependent oxidoreductase [Rhodococcus sp. T2V]MDF3304449.1 NAD(P)-dependent oxidoreductase [Rhodococcus sp. T2V]